MLKYVILLSSDCFKVQGHLVPRLYYFNHPSSNVLYRYVQGIPVLSAQDRFSQDMALVCVHLRKYKPMKIAWRFLLISSCLLTFLLVY